MESPMPPRDASIRNIIDKLAEFVARNGPEFEMITKQKQQGNPKFDFLYGGEYAGYYQYRVAAEQAYLNQTQNAISQQQHQPHHMLHQQQQQQHQQQLNPHYAQGPPQTMHHQQPSTISHDTVNFGINQPPPNHIWGGNNNTQQPNGNAIALNITAQIEAINIQQNTLRDQIHQSEANLTAQHTSMMAQQSKNIEEAIEKAQNTQLEKQAEEHGIALAEFDAILQPIIESCTKDSISAGKNWILQHSTDSAKNNVVLQYVLKKALVNGSTFQQKLHLIYLVNDVLHHCVRKNVFQLKDSLENVVIPMFCSADLIGDNEQRMKLAKLLSLWESKAKFFDACVISKLQSSDSSMQEYKTNLQNLHHEIATQYMQNTKATLESYQKQHQLFIQHATQQIAHLEQQKQQLEQQIFSSVLPNTSLLTQQQQQQQQQQLQPNKIPALMSKKISMPGTEDNDHINPPGVEEGNYGSAGSTNMFQQQQQPPPPSQGNPFASGGNKTNFQNNLQNQQQINHYGIDVLQHTPPNFFIPDLSKPPPGFLGNIGALAGAAQGSNQNSLQQQFAQMTNIPQNSASGGDVSNASNIVPVDVLAVTAALQLVQQQALQQQQLVQQQQQLKAQQYDMSPQPQQLADELPPAQLDAEEEPPSSAYYDLPAGLMVPLICLEDYKYKALDPTEVRLPPPAPQSERLTNALAAFYAPPTHDRPRDTEGWEKLGLYEYYKVKNAAKKQKEEEIQNGIRERTRSPTPIFVEKPKPKKFNKRCYRSKSRSRSKTRSPYRSASRSPPSRSNRETSRDHRDNRGSRNSRYSQRHRSPRRSPPRDRDRERSRDRDSSSYASSSNSREPRAEHRMPNRRDRSVTPPSFFGEQFPKPQEFIAETNKGHQMLMRMGWGGTGMGLGTKQQGIDQPISGGEIRDRKDMYKGVGVSLNDPFENFRKNKGAAFVHRMRSRDDKK